MFARRGNDVLTLSIFALLVVVVCLALYGLIVAHRYGFVVTLLALLIIASAMTNVCLNTTKPEEAGRIRASYPQSGDGRQTVEYIGDLGRHTDRELILSYRDSTQNFSATHTISVSVAPGDRLSLVVREGSQGVVVKRL